MRRLFRLLHLMHRLLGICWRAHRSVTPGRTRLALLACATVLGCTEGNAPTASRYAMAHPLHFALTSSFAAGEGAVVEVLVTYQRPSGTTVTIGHDSAVIGASGTGTTLPVTAKVAGCVSEAERNGTRCKVSLTLRLTRDGRLLDESTQRFDITASMQSVEVPPINLYEVSTVNITPSTLTNFELGDKLTLTATALDRSGTVLTGRDITWQVLSGNVTVLPTGAMSALGTGTARVRATVGGRVADLAFTVGAPTVATLELAPLDTLISTGGVATYRVVAKSSAGDVLSGRTITYTSSSPTTATLLANVATGVAVGTTTITARSAEGRAGATISTTTTLRVETAPPILVDRSTVALDSLAPNTTSTATTVAVTTAAGRTLRNLGATVTYTPNVTAWLTQTLSGTTLNGATPATLTLQASSGSLAAGDYVADVRLTSATDPHQPSTVRVTLRVVAARRVVLTPKPVNLGSYEGTQSAGSPVVVTVSSGTGAALAGLATNIEYLGSTTGWLTSALFATSASPSTTLTLTPRPFGLAVGSHQARVIVTSTTLGALPDTTIATLTVVPTIIPSILVDRTTVVLDSLAPGTTGTATTVAVTTTAGKTIGNLGAAVTYTPNVTPWLTAVSLSGTTLNGATPVTLTMRAASGALSAGDYAADVRLTSTTDPYQPNTVHVTLRVVGARRVVLNPKTANLGTFLPTVGGGSSTIIAVNSSSTAVVAGLTATIEYINTATGWLTVALGATSAPPTTTLTLTPKPLGLATGTYLARVIVSSTTLGGSPDTVLASMSVAPAAVQWAQVATGDAYTCGRTSAGAVWCWGYNSKGQLGNNTTTDARAPVPVSMPPGVTFVDISAGSQHHCGRTSAGAVWCWGLNVAGQLGNNTTTDAHAPVPVSMPPGVAFVDMSAGITHTCGRTSAGAVWCWGGNSNGQLGNNGTNFTYPPVPVSMPPGVTFVDISAGTIHTCGRTSAGAVWCWGSNSKGQLGNNTITDTYAPVPVSMPPGVAFVDISANTFHTCGRTSAGAVWCWGLNGTSQLGNTTTTDAQAPVPVSMPPGVAFVDISAGSQHTCGRTSAGAVWCWGRNTFGELGNNGTTDALTPVQVLVPSAVQSSVKRRDP